jgi:hypothetical protein
MRGPVNDAAIEDLLAYTSAVFVCVLSVPQNGTKSSF